MSHVVQVLDANGTVIFSEVIPDISLTGTNFETAVANGQVQDTPAARALLIAAPEVCPWDCDGCKE